MQTLEKLIKKRRPKKEVRKVKFQFQDIALELIEKFNVQGKDKKVMFAFLKRQLNKGMWWKVKEVTSYMESKGIFSHRYFMACFRKNMNKDRTKKEVHDIIELWNTKEVKKREYAQSKLRMSKWFLKPEVYEVLAKKMKIKD